MKKPILISTLVALMLPASAWAEGKIDLDGAVTEGTCIYADGPDGQTVNMPTISAALLATAGAVSSVTPFEIELKSCSVAQRVAVLLNGAVNGDSSTGNLRNAAIDNAARNVQVGVVDRANGGAPLRLPGSSVGVTSTATGVAVIPLGLRYVSMGGITGGVVTTAMDFTIVYP